ncbi:MAG TPA: PP2C family protein-serine/threonine phosphatase [Terracidiphilus sp.]|jgi:sigma-B regulation protein RsbU (phosphoserine phosphatase)|nr:PP2C family protein-serine/threonine phosphatase [Terracidiphilus sp.]
MLLADAQLTTNEVLRTFQRDAAGLWLGAAISTVGIMAAALCVIRRRADGLLTSLAAFAILYGLRLWLEDSLVVAALPAGELVRRLRDAINPAIPIPGFLYFQIAGLLPRRSRAFTYTLVSAFLGLTVATLAVGRVPILHTINNALVTAALILVLIRSLLVKSASWDIAILRRGMLLFVVLALWDNTGAPYWRLPELELYGLTFFLGCMGYVAARRTLERDERLGELHSELEVARRIQLSLLPPEFPKARAFEVAACYVPMTSVAGDFYDFLDMGSEQTGLLIADVSGHGVPAALIASMVKLAASSQRAHAESPAKLLAGMNAALCGNTQGQYVTAAYVHLDADKHELHYAAAGHPAMLLLRNGNVIEVEENGLLLAVVESARYTERTVALEAGDRLMLYTDGLPEARNQQGKLFGEAALQEAMRVTAELPPEQAANRIVREIQNWSTAQDDDLTLLICDFKGLATRPLAPATADQGA